MTNNSVHVLKTTSQFRETNVLFGEPVLLCEEQASYWLAVVFRIRSGFLLSLVLRACLTSVRCSKCALPHQHIWKEGQWLTQCPWSFYFLILTIRGMGRAVAGHTVRTFKPLLLQAGQYRWALGQYKHKKEVKLNCLGLKCFDGPLTALAATMCKGGLPSVCIQEQRLKSVSF